MSALRPLLFSDERWRLVWPPGMGFFLAWVAWAGYRAWTSPIPYAGLTEWLQLLALPAVYWAVSDLAGRYHRWRWMTLLLLTAVISVTIYGLIQHLRGTDRVLQFLRLPVYAGRLSATYFCPNHFANILELAFPFCLALLLCRDAGFSIRSLSLYGLVVMTPALYLTQSRSGWLAVLFGLSVTSCALAWRKSGRRFAVVLGAMPLLAAAIAFAAYAALPLVTQRVNNAMKGNMRIVLWKDTVRMIKDSPWVGHGLGTYRYRFQTWQFNYHENYNPIYAHQELLQTVAETGAVGGVLVAGLVVAGGIGFGRRLRRTERENGAALIAGLLGAVAAAVLHSCFDYNFHLFANNHLLIAFAGVTAAVLGSSNQLKTWEAPRPLRWAVAAGAIPICAALLYFYDSAALAELADRRGVREAEDFDYGAAERSFRSALRHSALYWHPWVGLGDLRLRQSFWNRLPADQKTQRAEAGEFYERALKGNPWDLDAMYGLTKVLDREGKPDESLAMWRRLIRAAPIHAFYQVEFGEALMRAGLNDEALLAFRQSQRLYGSEAAALHIREIEAASAKP